MGPALCERVRGARSRGRCRRLGTRRSGGAGRARGAGRPHRRARRQSRAHRASTRPWARPMTTNGSRAFRHLVDPLPRLVRAVLPQMIGRRSGKILLLGSASALRGMKRSRRPTVPRVARNSPTCRRSGSNWRRTTCRSMRSRRISSRTRRTSRPTCRRCPRSRSGSSARCRSVDWSARARTRRSLPTSAAAPPTASSGRCFRSAAAGSRAGRRGPRSSPARRGRGRDPVSRAVPSARCRRSRRSGAAPACAARRSSWPSRACTRPGSRVPSPVPCAR